MARIKILGTFSVYTGSGSGADAPKLTDPRLAYLDGSEEFDFNRSDILDFDFNKIVIDISM